ncbi:MAG: hypothetical protein AMXMBFR75_13270 [Candidatus Hinthialibacteria bacterium]
MLGVLIVCASATRQWWISEGLANLWNEKWMMVSTDSRDPREMLLTEHLKLMNAIETRYSEELEKEKKRHELLRAEFQRLRGMKTQP